jgi:hypothetical protein
VDEKCLFPALARKAARPVGVFHCSGSANPDAVKGNFWHEATRNLEQHGRNRKFDHELLRVSSKRIQHRKLPDIWQMINRSSDA